MQWYQSKLGGDYFRVRPLISMGVFCFLATSRKIHEECTSWSFPSFALSIHNLAFSEVLTASVLLQVFCPPLLFKNLKEKTYHLLLLHHQKVGTAWSRLTLPYTMLRALSCRRPAGSFLDSHANENSNLILCYMEKIDTHQSTLAGKMGKQNIFSLVPGITGGRTSTANSEF